MERPAQCGLFTQAVRLTLQRPRGGQTGLYDVPCFLQENVDQVVFHQIFAACVRYGGRCWHGRGRGQRGQTCQCLWVHRRRGRGFHGGHNRRHLASGLGQGRAVSQGCLLSQPVEPGGQRGQVCRAGTALRCLDHTLHHLFDLDVERGLGCRGFDNHRTRSRPAHDRPQFAIFGIEHKQLPGQRGLVIEHVNQETQCAEVVGQPTEGACLFRAFRIDLVDEQGLDVGAHVGNCRRCLIQPQHRQHAPHLRQFLRHGRQQLLVGRITRKLVQLLLQLSQADLELTHHAAHGLLVADLAVQHLHPVLKRL